MGPIEAHLRRACAYWPQWETVIARAGTDMGARLVIYGAGMKNGVTRGISAIVDDGDLPDVLTEAICAAEALGL